MDRIEFDSLLGTFSKIYPLPETEKARILPLLQLRLLKKGEFFIKAGETPFHVGFLVSGFIRYFYPGNGGKEFIKHFCFDGHFVTSHTALVSRSPSEYSIEAIENCRLIVFLYSQWLELLECHPAWGIINGKVQSDALELAERRERSLLLDDATTRYLKLLEEVPGIESRVRQYDLANYLGITPVALSRLRSKPLRKLT